MRKLFQMGAGSWWRYAEYEIQSGFIQPRRDAILEEYDPWELHIGGKKLRGIKEAPYQTLINLVRKAARYTGGNCRFRPSESWRRELLDWCSCYGLLGVLPQITQSVMLAPRWGKSLKELKAKTGKTTIITLSPEAYRYNRANGGWYRQRYGGVLIRSTVQRRYSKQMEGQSVPKHLWPPGWPWPTAFIEPLDGIPGEWQEEPIIRTWARFFPGVPKHKREVYAYPMPGTAEFWREYAEPEELFWSRGMGLAEIHETLFEVKGKLEKKRFQQQLALALSWINTTMRLDKWEDEREEAAEQEDIPWAAAGFKDTELGV